MPAIKAPATVLVTGKFESYVSETPNLILLLGANGFYGTWVSKTLLEAGYSVR